MLAENPALEDDPVERLCARLLRERLISELDGHWAGEGFRSLNILFARAPGPLGAQPDADRDR